MRRNVVRIKINDDDRYTLYKYLLANHKSTRVVSFLSIEKELKGTIDGNSLQSIRHHLHSEKITAYDGQGILNIKEDGWNQMKRFIEKYELTQSRISKSDKLMSKQIHFYKYRVLYSILLLILGGILTLLGRYVWLLMFPSQQ